MATESREDPLVDEYEDPLVDDYRVGRLVAQCLLALGGLAAAYGLFDFFTNLARASADSALVLVIPFGIIVGGIFACASGLASLALFDGASDARRIRVYAKRMLDKG